MEEALYFIKVVDKFSSGLLQRQSTISHMLLTKDITKAKFFRSSDEAEDYIKRVSEKFPLVNYQMLFGALEVNAYEV